MTWKWANNHDRLHKGLQSKHTLPQQKTGRERGKHIEADWSAEKIAKNKKTNESTLSYNVSRLHSFNSLIRQERAHSEKHGFVHLKRSYKERTKYNQIICSFIKMFAVKVHF